MAGKRKTETEILIDQDKIETLSRLKEEGFDTANKIRTLDMDDLCDHGLESELKNILALKKAIKANHSEIAWLLDGEDPKPARKEEHTYADDGGSADTGGSIYSETYA